MMPTFPRSPLSFRTAGFPQYGWKAGFPSGAFLGDQRLKPAPGMRRPTSSLYPPFVRLVVSTVVPLCVGPPTRLRSAVEGHYSSAPGALAQVRVIAVSYTHLRAHETRHDLVCRLLLEKKKKNKPINNTNI